MLGNLIALHRIEERSRLRTGLANVLGEIANRDFRASGGKDQPSHQVLELPDVSRVVVTEEDTQRFRAERSVHSEPPIELVDEGVDERLQVFTTLPYGGDVERDLLETVEKILSKLSRFHHLSEVSVRRRDDTHVHLSAAPSTHPMDPFFLQELEELRLRNQRKLADLVEKDRSAMGQLEQTLLPRA